MIYKKFKKGVAAFIIIYALLCIIASFYNPVNGILFFMGLIMFMFALFLKKNTLMFWQMGLSATFVGVASLVEMQELYMIIIVICIWLLCYVVNFVYQHTDFSNSDDADSE